MQMVMGQANAINTTVICRPLRTTKRVTPVADRARGTPPCASPCCVTRRSEGQRARPGASMNKLVGGLHQFQQHVFRPQREFFEQLERGQTPEVLFITCSDSRINPNLITQTEPGELFIIRNAGNIVPCHSHDPGGEAATIEYAVDALGVSDIIVCGHSQCGAMKGLMAPEALTRLPIVREWLKHADATRRIVEEAYAHLSGDALLEVLVAENVLVQIDHLRTQPAVAAGLARGKLRLHAWVYEIASGGVLAYDPVQGQYEPIQGKLVPVAAGTRSSGKPWV
jgi:carbonic anhydrase